MILLSACSSLAVLERIFWMANRKAITMSACTLRHLHQQTRPDQPVSGVIAGAISEDATVLNGEGGRRSASITAARRRAEKQKAGDHPAFFVFSSHCSPSHLFSGVSPAT